MFFYIYNIILKFCKVFVYFVGIIEHGLADSSHYQPRRSFSDDFSSPEVIYADKESLPMSTTDNKDISKELEGRFDVTDQLDQSKTCHTSLETHYLHPHGGSLLDLECEWETLEPDVMDDMEGKVDKAHSSMFDTDSGLPITVQPQSATGQGTLTSGLVSGLQEDQYGEPLAIFTKVCTQNTIHIHHTLYGKTLHLFKCILFKCMYVF